MSVRRRKKGHGGGGEHEGGGSERWTTSYMDMVTVLMCLFIVLYAMSSVDKDKFEKLRLALSTGFGVTKTHDIDTASGVVVPAKDVGKKGVDATNDLNTADYDAAVAEVSNLTAIEKAISQALTAKGLQANVGFSIDSGGLTVRLIGSATFFAGNSAVLKTTTRQTLSVIGRVLAHVPNQIAVEGHADSHGNPSPYPSDWDLAAARSTGVLRYLVDHSGVPGTRIYSSSYGAARPLRPGMSASQYKLNRRVDIVVLSSAPEDVRNLIAKVLAAEH
jgi:chemotaxis protein MotB